MSDRMPPVDGSSPNAPPLPLQPRGALAQNLRDLIRIEAPDIAALTSLAAMILFFSLAANSFFQVETLTLLMKESTAPLLVAVGLTFVLLCGEIDLSVGMMATFAGCLCGRLLQMPAIGEGGVPLTLLVAAVVGFITGVITVWTRLGSFIITLAMMFVLEGATTYITQGESPKAPPLLISLATGEIRITQGLKIPHMAWIGLATAVMAFLVLRYTRAGRYLYMTGGNREAARLAGVRTHWVLISVLTISAICAAAGGMLQGARVRQYSATDNSDLLLKAVACVVLGGTSLFGGVGGIARTVVGVCIFGVLDLGLHQVDWINEYARNLLMGIVLLAAMILNGLLAQGRITSWFRKLTSFRKMTS